MRDMFIVIKALRKKYEAVIEEAKATAEVYLHRPVGIGEHPQFIEELDKLINTIAEAEDKLTVIRNRFDEDIPF